MFTHQVVVCLFVVLFCSVRSNMIFFPPLLSESKALPLYILNAGSHVVNLEVSLGWPAESSPGSKVQMSVM